MPVAASSDFGSIEEAQSIAGSMSDIIRSNGLDAGIAAMHDPAQPFAASPMGIHVFEQSIIVADNREPELIASSYAEIEDLTGEPMWPRIVAAADASTDAQLEWYHYDTEAEYTYQCHSEWATPGEVIVMVCR
ncbi:hypothetical protein [Roseobacter sinensis]|uniref:Uncharacterized protein n=1 Tax=Roseobacter sinensis TaxID=2931391 RepID=A0ABT3BIT7_9RHOB|nr:hypothetical protein [Roseobacter sp. WL0113]MCV3273467.1 hypothetical protein [Roseobacter sp. WL0113]